jgi:hypothetical protein
VITFLEKQDWMARNAFWKLDAAPAQSLLN